MISYLDNASTTKVCPEAVSAMVRVMEEDYGNPSSLHKMGVRAEKVLSESREIVASAIGCRASEVYFTSGGTEADNWAVFSGASCRRHGGRHIITTAIEHAAVSEPFKRLEESGYEVDYLKPGKGGKISVEDLKAALRPDTILVSMMLVNNETGAIQPVSEAVRAVRSAGSGALFHVDAVQGFLKLPFRPMSVGADLVSVSSHKIHGPKGAGALAVRSSITFPPLFFGGGQEGGFRPGTEATPQIAGFAAACKVALASLDDDIRRMRSLVEMMEKRLRAEIPDIIIIGEDRAPHILSVSLPGYKSEVLLSFLESYDVYVSKGSACKKGKRSGVLEAMGLPNEVIDGSIRASLSRFSTEADVDSFCSALAKAKKELFPVIRP